MLVYHQLVQVMHFWQECQEERCVVFRALYQGAHDV